MKKHSLISSDDIVRLDVKLNPHNDHEELFRYHQFACGAEPDALRLRDIKDFEGNPNHVMVWMWLIGSDKPITVSSAVIFEVDNYTAEIGSLFVSPLVRGMGLGQMTMDAAITKFNDDHHLAKHDKVSLTAKVRYGNYAPIPILNKSGFKVDAISEKKVHWSYDPTSSHATACRLYDKIIATDATIEDDLFQSLSAVHGNVKAR